MLFLYIIGGLLVFVICATLLYQVRLLGHRGTSREAFIAEFLRLRIPDNIPAAVYDYYKQDSLWKGFSVSTDDTLAGVFGRSHEDIEDDLEELLLQKLGMQYPREAVLEQWKKPLETLRDIVLWLDWIRQHQPATVGAPGRVDHP